MAEISLRQLRDPQYVTAIEYDPAGNPVYVGEAQPGVGEAKPKWRIKLITYDPINNPVNVRWAEGNTNFDKRWSERTAYSYS